MFQRLNQKTITRAIATPVRLSIIVSTSIRAIYGQNLHKTHCKHNADTSLFPRGQVQLENLVDRHEHHDRVHPDIDIGIDECNRDEVDTLPWLTSRPLIPGQVNWEYTGRNQ